MDISKWAFKNRNLVYFLVTVLFVGGILSCYQMSKLEDPEIKVKLAMVVTTYPGGIRPPGRAGSDGCAGEEHPQHGQYR